MLISYSHRFIFFHVAKVAGLSIREALKDYVEEPEQFRRMKRPPQMSGDQPNPLYAMWDSMLLHTKARDAQYGLPPEVFNGFYKFAFVRNPWDWQVSMYHFILKEPKHIHYQTVRNMASFEDYINWVIRTNKPFARGATKLQKDMLTDDMGNLMLDFVGRYETLGEDFATICRRLQLDATLPYLNQSRTDRDYKTYYNDRTRQLVEEHFQADISLFGYDWPCAKQ